jgi:signal transduction histidine kinase
MTECAAGKPRGGPPWAALAGLAALALLAVVGWDSARLVGRTFPGFLVWDNGVLASFHREDWTGARAGLPGNGRLLEVEAWPFRGGAELLALAARTPEGTPLAYRVSSRAGPREARVAVMRFRWVDHLSTFTVYLGASAVLFLVMWVALLLRPDHATARALAAAAGNLGLVLALSVDFLCGYRLTGLYPLAETLLPGTLVWFALAFPKAGAAAPASGRRRRIALAVGAALLLALGGLQALLFRADPELHFRITGAIYLLLAAALLGMLASFGHQLLASRSPEARMRAGVVFAGGIASAAPAAILLSAMFLLGFSFSVTWVVAFVPFLPVSILYAVLYRDLLAAERFIRLATSYALATTAIVIGYLLALFGLERLAFSGVGTGPVATLGLLVALVLALDPLRARIQRGIDRVFFRTRVDVAGVLERTSTEFALLLEEGAIGEHARRVLREALALEWAELCPPAAPREDAELRERVALRGAPLGVICCGPKRSGAPFSAAERELVRGVASQAALALQNARTLAALRAAQDDLVRAERFAAIGELSAAVAHGLRNPLAGIRAAAQVAHGAVKEESAAQALSDVLSEVDRLAARVRTLLDFSRPFEPRFEQVDVAELLRVLSRGLASATRARGVALEVEAPAGRVEARADPNLLEEAIQELAGNALRALGAGGSLRLSLAVEGERLAIRVTDSGGGIPAGVQQRVFDPFFTTRSDGTGMGLPTVKRLLESQGGRALLESSAPGRTVFRIELPLSSRGAGESVAPRERGAGRAA